MSHLDGLNERQRRAVTAPLAGRLQVVAGPGTGKTKVLTSRVAHMILDHGVSPNNILVTTFTKKAANEMKLRLETMLHTKSILLSGLYMGTFHSICYRILSIHGGKIGLKNFRVADESDSARLLAQAVNNVSDEDMKSLPELSHRDWLPFLSANDKLRKAPINTTAVKKQISALKGQGISCSSYCNQKDANTVLQFFYQKYTEELTKNRRFDFDDCLLYCYELLLEYPVMSFIEHVIVDEFQDTNAIQLKLMFQLAGGRNHNVTVVGDPDQSIYAFRGAQSANFEQMKNHYRDELSLECNVITLNENYRSTSSILDLSEDVMRQASGRHQKSLKSHAKYTFKTTHATCENSDQEAQWIAFQIEQLLTLPTDILQGKDIAILVRASNETRVIEKALTKKSIPYKMLKGRAFWSRSEVVALIDIFRVIGDQNDTIAIFRSLGSLKGVGESSISKLQGQIRNHILNDSQLVLDLVSQLSASSEYVKTKKARDSIAEFIGRIQKLSQLLEELELHKLATLGEEDRKATLQEYFATVFSTFEMGVALKDDEEKEGNIAEVRQVFCEFVPQESPIEDFVGSEYYDPPEQTDNSNFIVEFVDSIGLYQTSDDENDDSSDKLLRTVTLSTVHGSKALEWKAVFVPGLTEGIFPSRFSVKDEKAEAIHEERRCFYVATTRAKILLYLSSVENVGSFNAPVSRFIRDLIPTHMVPFHPTVLQKPKKLLQLVDLCTNVKLQELDPEQVCQKYTTCYENQDGLPSSEMEANVFNDKSDFFLFSRPQTKQPVGRAPAYAPIRNSNTLNKSRMGTTTSTSRLPMSLISKGTINNIQFTNRTVSNTTATTTTTTTTPTSTGRNRAPAYKPVRLNAPINRTGVPNTRTPQVKRFAPQYVVERPLKKKAQPATSEYN